MDHGDKRGEKKRKKPRREAGLGQRFREAWTWYLSEGRREGFGKETAAEKQERIDSGLSLYIAAFTVFLLFMGAPIPMVMISAMTSVISFARAYGAVDPDGRYAGLASFAEVVLLFFLFVQLAVEFVF